tara:strand:+ start:1869 stop:2114 length:246 start_codon:yes stop_codon:yes gene_type:complete
MKVRSLDKDENVTVELRQVEEYDYFQLPMGDKQTVYQKIGYNECSMIAVMAVSSGRTYQYEADKKVLELDCELVVKRRVYC